MKRLFYILLLIVVISSCKSKTEQAATDTTSAAAVNDAEVQKLITQFKPIIEGVWVKKDYVENVKSTRSPYKSREKFGGVACLEIYLPDDGSDSTHVGVSLNNHEGSNFVLFLKQGHLSTSLKTGLPDYDVKGNSYEIGYEINKNETNLILYHYDTKGKIIDKTPYTKVANRSGGDNDAAWGIQYITNKLLFKGEYMVMEHDVPVYVEFKDNGEIIGLPDVKNYYINTDFAAGPENNLDEIIFDLYTKNQTLYAFKLDADTLNLYYTKSNIDSTLLLVDKLKYKLVRKK